MTRSRRSPRNSLRLSAVVLAWAWATTGLRSEEVRLASAQAGSVGLLRGADVRMDVSVAAVGLSASNGPVRFDPGFVGGLPNRAPRSAEVRVARATGVPTAFPASWILRQADDPDGDLLRLLSVSPVSRNGGRAELYSGWVLFAPAEGDSTTDLLSGVVADSYGDAVEVAVRILPDGGPEPEWAGRGIPPRLDPEGGLLLRFAGTPGRVHRLQSSTVPDGGPADWRDVAELTADGQGLVTHVVTDVPGAPMRFYRLVAP